jgi:hypothetical protein
LGELDFYRNEYWQPLQAYATPNAILVSGNMDKMFEVVTSDSFTPGESVLFLSEQVSSSQWQFIQEHAITQQAISVPVYKGSKKSFNWLSLGRNTSEARFYEGWESVIRTDGKEKEDTLSFSSLNEAPYQFPPYSSDSWSALNSTLIFIETDSQALRIDGVLENERPVTDIIGIWWETGWMGMDTKHLTYPIVIPPNQKAIIQINHEASNIVLSSWDSSKLSKPNENENKPLTIHFQKINPTKYEIKVTNATQPFFLVFSESYHPQWKAYVNPQADDTNWLEAFFQKSIPDDEHFPVNGYANAWYIDPTEQGTGKQEFGITLYFKPQSLFYLGCTISGLTFVCCIGCLAAIWHKGKKRSRLTSKLTGDN